jgi:hypothetical protein
LLIDERERVKSAAETTGSDDEQEGSARLLVAPETSRLGGRIDPAAHCSLGRAAPGVSAERARSSFLRFA